MSWVDDLVSQSPMRSRIGFKGELEFAGAAESDQSGRTVTFKIIRRPEEAGAAHPFSTFTRRRGKRAGSIFEGAITSVATGAVVYKDELMLAGWGDGPQGAAVKFWTDPSADRHPFLGCTRGSKQAAGDRFMCVLLEKQDDEQIVEQERVERVESAQREGRRPQKLSNAVTIIIKQQRFHDWLGEVVDDKRWDFALADQWLKSALDIGSKSELDGKNEAAIVGWNRLRLRYVAWQEEHGLIDERHQEY